MRDILPLGPYDHGGLRCFVRFRLTHAGGCDDYIMVTAMFFNIGFGTCTIIGATFGMGKQLVDFDSDDSPLDFRNAFLCFWLGQLFYVVTSVLVRLSITVTLVRLTVDNVHRGILGAATILSVVAGTIFFFFTIFQCTPVDYYWNRLTKEGHCMDIDLLVGIVYMYSAAAAVCDFTIGPLPAFMIGRLKMDRHTKMAVIGVLSIGCVASTAVIVRLPFVRLSKSREFLCNILRGPSQAAMADWLRRPNNAGFDMVEYRDLIRDYCREFNDGSTLFAGDQMVTYR
ncbi:hypothetical protein KXW28_007957 [Aspergillus fumigatus]|nr:hypothetical protein KXX63_000483 [Aspergillus fumigatus]KAH2343367.1 hypothetical protein KXW30_000739 [Aspergillus fumigatus]KAH2516636.1 hypothetical protein KXW70_004300 [Aspergillus fumigatus]KAH2924223.1 hypothetical protein KXW73_000818 [Aspergillus fumigatus]KAH3089929.1 hypothetical protein KXW28_007957 [Aspergillus fumigatus]